MKVWFTFAALAVAFTAYAQGQHAPLMINTPINVQQCSSTFLSVSGGIPPYEINVNPPDPIAGGTFPDFTIVDNLSGTTFNWIVDLPGGTSCTLSVRDATGAINFSGAVNVLNSNNSGCLNGGLSSSISTTSQSTSTQGSPNTSSSSPTQAGSSTSLPSSPTQGGSNTSSSSHAVTTNNGSETSTGTTNTSLPTTSATQTSDKSTSTTTIESTSVGSVAKETSSRSPEPSGTSMSMTSKSNSVHLASIFSEGVGKRF
ncbi:hypothetical protein M422DRAFT_251109 [Sphaerobolus stellatus SS14]|uniref:Ubiquitin 3 binding protein But2 C-terminal domain-containing protein n=1 Tax=Sphaerobolus stellatus (strain SS14) TaxID=990650 RepID=A0A0C9VS85_SPHS4|nr:hypothetical protein M422DRAFT_251109 [Sphaerobolus stellatus SS14]